MGNNFHEYTNALYIFEVWWKVQAYSYLQTCCYILSHKIIKNSHTYLKNDITTYRVLDLTSRKFQILSHLPHASELQYLSSLQHPNLLQNADLLQYPVLQLIFMNPYTSGWAYLSLPSFSQECLGTMPWEAPLHLGLVP